MTSTTNKRRTELPKPLYAVAGAGDLAYQGLRRLPGMAARTAEQLRERLGEEGDLTNRIRVTAQRGTEVVRERAARAQQRATTGYRELVARGERVVATRMGEQDPQEGQVEVIVGPVSRDERPGAAADEQPKSEEA